MASARLSCDAAECCIESCADAPLDEPDIRLGHLPMVGLRPPCLAKDKRCPVKYGRVLLADSHLNMLAGVHSLLETVFDSVLMASDEQSMMEAISGLHHDLVITDLSLPGPSQGAGIKLVTRLKHDYPGLPIIVLSVHDDPIVVAETRSAGAAGFVLKRSASTDLIPAVRAVIAGGEYVSPSVCWPEPRQSQR